MSDFEFERLTEEQLAEVVRGLEAAAYEAKRWTLQERQQRAEDFASAAEPGMRFELFYGGAAGGGKTVWQLWHLYNIAMRYPGTRSLMLRRSFPELRRNAIFKSFELFDRSHCRWVESHKEWQFDNGSIIEMGYLDNDLDVYNYQGADYVCVCWDELTQWPTDYCYTYLLSRMRASIERIQGGLVPHVIAASNPGGVGGNWVKARFIDIGEPETIHETLETIDLAGEQIEVRTRRVFVPAKVSDNRYIDRASYAAQFAGATSARSVALREALLNGSWDAIEGQYFTEWNRAHHVVAPFDIPSHWVRARGIDYGFTNPMACVWGAFDGDGNCYIYRELYGTEMVPPIQARRILELSHNERIDYTVADPAIWIRTGAGAPIAQQYADAGLHTRRAMNARIDGWARVRWYLQPDPERADLEREDYVPPKLYVFDHCLNLIRSLPLLVHDLHNPEDLDTDGEDHLADALRYLLMSRPRPVKEGKVEDQSLEARLSRKHSQRRARRGGSGPFVGSAP